MEITIGTKIWRPVSLDYIDGAKIESPDFDDSKPGTTIIRATQSQRRLTKQEEWTVMPVLFNRGLVLFCHVPIPPDWTYFEVIRLNKGGKSAIVKPVAGEKQELFSRYQLDLIGDRIAK